MEQLYEEYLNYMERQKRCSILTLRNYRADIERFARWLMQYHQDESITIEQATIDDIRAWIIYRVEEDRIAPASMNRELATLRSLYKWAVARNHITANPIRTIKALKVAAPLPHFIPRTKMSSVVKPPKEIDNWDDYRADRDRMIIITLYYTGLRLSELASLRQSSFNSDLSMLRVIGKGDKERVIPIANRLQSELFQYFTKLIAQNIWISSDNYLFLTKRGSSLSRSSIYRVVRRELGEADVDGRKSPHIMRHTFATHLLNGGADIRVIQELLGHSSLRATQRYTHNSISTLKETYKKSHPRGGGERE
ncbi:MAG: tyrosine-type recombinase/integrase [Rikenellaceae bacterium]